MIGLGKVWKAVTGQGPGAPLQQPSAAAISRALPVSRPRPAEAAWVDGAPSETRSAQRFVPHRTSTVLTTASGKRIAARVINISQVGVALEAELGEHQPADIATVGSRPVTPGRRIALGMVFLFKKPLDPKLCNSDIVL